MVDQATLNQNEAVVERFFEEVFNHENYDVLSETHTDDAVNHGPPGAEGDLRGHEAAKEYFVGIHEAFPDVHAEVETLVPADDYVTARVTYTGTHQGEFMGIPATEKHVEVEGILMNRMEDGKIAETWGQIDAVSLMEQVGAL